MKLVKYISMLLVVFVFIGNCSCSSTNGTGGTLNTSVIPTIVSVASDRLIIDVSSDLTLCESGQMEMILPNERISAGGIYYRNARGSLDFISNPTSNSYSPANLILPVIKNSQANGLDAKATIDFFKSYTQSRVGATFERGKNINLSLALTGTRIYTLTQDQIGEVIINAQDKLFNSQEVSIYKSVIYASGISYEFEKLNSTNGYAGLDIDTVVFDASVSGRNFAKEKSSNSIVGQFSTPQAVLFCKASISRERIQQEIARRPPSISYKVVQQYQHGCGGQRGVGSPWDKDGSSNHIGPSAEQLYFFSFDIKNKPANCEVKYSANTNPQAYSNGNGWAGNPDPCMPIQQIKAKLENCPSNWRVNYRVNTWRNGQNSGAGEWQPWQCNENPSGVAGRSIVAMEAKITTNSECLR